MNSLLDFDQVVALTQQTINSQFELMFLNGTIDKNLKVVLPSSDNVGITGILNSPTVSISLNDGTVDPQQVRFNINFQTGTATYFSPIGELKHEIIDGYTIALNVNLTKLTVDSNYTGLKVGAEAKSKIDKYLNQDLYSVTAILLDFDNVNYSTAVIYKPDGSICKDSTLTTLLSEIINALIKEGNPYLISVHPEDKKQKETGLDGFKPTAVMYNTHLYNNTNADSGLSTYNMCIMNQHHPLPWTNVTLPKFTHNLIEHTDTYGRMFISNTQFCSVYIDGFVLPILRDAMGCYSNFVSNGSSWTYDYQTNQNNEHDGHGPVVGSDSGLLSIYGNQQRHDHCELNFSPSDSTPNSIVLKGSGSFNIKTDYYEHPFIPIYFKHVWAHDAWNRVKKSFTFSIVIEAGADGKITISFNKSSSSPDKDSWENPVVKITDVFAKLFKKDFQSQLEHINACYAGFESARFDSFTSEAQDAFNALENRVILPGATTYFFKNATVDADSNIQFDLAIKD